MQQISREQVLSLMRKNASIIEVLPEQSYRTAHLPGAINVPLDAAFDERIQTAVPDKNMPVIVYCASSDCQLSPQAAEHLDRLGYTKVFDYKAGKKIGRKRISQSRRVEKVRRSLARGRIWRSGWRQVASRSFVCIAYPWLASARTTSLILFRQFSRSCSLTARRPESRESGLAPGAGGRITGVVLGISGTGQLLVAQAAPARRGPRLDQGGAALSTTTGFGEEPWKQRT